MPPKKSKRKAVAAKNPGPQPSVVQQPPTKKQNRQDGQDKMLQVQATLVLLLQTVGLLACVQNPKGRSRTYPENAQFLTVVCQLHKEAIEAEQKRYQRAAAALAKDATKKKEERLGGQKLSKLKKAAEPKDMSGYWKTAARRAADLVHMQHELADEIVQEFVSSAEAVEAENGKLQWEANVIVNTTKDRGKGSTNYINNAKCFEPEHIKAIDAFVDKCHADGKGGGGTVTVASISAELEEKFEDLEFSPDAVLYALRNFCNSGEGYKWGKVKPRKCESDPERLEVKRTYMRDYSWALKKEEAGTHVIVYIDGVQYNLIYLFVLISLTRWSLSSP